MTSILGRVAPGWSSKFNLLIDVVLLLAALLFASMWEYGLRDFPAHELVAFCVTAIAVWIVTATALRHYDPWCLRSRGDDVAMCLVLVAALITVLLVTGAIAPDAAQLPDPAIVATLLTPTLIAFRLLVARPLAMGDEPVDEVLIIGTGALARVTAEDIEFGQARRAVMGFLSLPGETPPAALGERYLGTWERLSEVLEQLPVSEVYLAGDLVRHSEALQSSLKICETLGTPFALPSTGLRLERARPADARSIRDGFVHYLNVDSKPAQMAVKRLFDIVASAIALWLLLPLFLAVAALIKLSSRGPVFFRQVRVGLHGKQFHMLKFRSMVVDAEQLKERLAAQNEMAGGPTFKMKNDPRVTWIGRFIRKYSIDELPQLINVLRGEMTIVGPRPPVPKEVAQYKQWQRRRLSVRPGLTCVWQVSGRNQISFEEWMYLDMQYIDTWSLARDLQLIARTVPVVLTGKGAS